MKSRNMDLKIIPGGFTRLLPKPPGCFTCVLGQKGFGYATARGALSAPVLILGESSGRREAVEGKPFVGPAGAMLHRAMRLGMLDPDWFRIDNVVRCQPPGDFLDGAPWQYDAIAKCSQYLNQTLAENHPVVVTTGGLATRTLLQLPRDRHFKVQNFHGTVQRDPLDRFWVVPTFHPSYLQRGATNLLDVLRYDLARAVEIARTPDFQRTPTLLTKDPGIEYFRAWAKLYHEALARGEPVDLVVDIETMDSADVEEDERKDISWQITRINFAYNSYEGVTVPFEGIYLQIIRELLASTGAKIFWNKKFDVPRLAACGFRVNGEIYDYMWAWHILQSNLPRGLGFVAPFYSDNPPWKHLADSDPAEYGAYDGVIPWRIAQGITTDLVKQNLWHVFKRHNHDFHKIVLDPAEDVGLLINRERIEIFRVELQELKAEKRAKLQPLTPWETRAQEYPKGWVKLSKKLKENPWGLYSEKVARPIQVCRACGAEEVTKTHKCKGSDGKILKDVLPMIVIEERPVVRMFRRKPFNPDSWQQVLAYIKSQKHKPGLNPKKKTETTDKETLARLFKKHRDPVYKLILDNRKVSKVLGTYVVGTIDRMDEFDRVHPTFTQKPSTLRRAAENPNTMNVIDDKDGDNPAAGFRKCIVAGKKDQVALQLKSWKLDKIHPESCMLVESDYKGIEAVLVGWFSGDPEYIRFAHLGIHARLASLILDKPADPAWSDDELVGYFGELKEENAFTYDQSKRTVHGSNYGLTEYGMAIQFPEIFPTLKIARRYQGLYWEMAPKVKDWQNSVRIRAYDQNYLGGPGDHPYGYKHRFYDVLAFKPITVAQMLRRKAAKKPYIEIDGRWYGIGFGTDAKKCVAFFPQSTGNGTLTECGFRLFSAEATPPDGKSYLGDIYFGRTPLRTPVHDSFLIEVPKSKVDFAVEALVREMIRPVEALPCPPEWGIGSHLNFGVEVKVGKDWEDRKRGGTMSTVFTARGGGVKDDGTVDYSNLTGPERAGVALDLRSSPSEADEFEEEELLLA